MRREAGRTRHKLAEMIQNKLTEMGVEHRPFDGNDLLPVTGYWKSQDCYRWESVGLRAVVDGREINMSVCGWEPMTTCIRAKNITIGKAFNGLPYQYEVYSE